MALLQGLSKDVCLSLVEKEFAIQIRQFAGEQLSPSVIDKGILVMADTPSMNSTLLIEAGKAIASVIDGCATTLSQPREIGVSQQSRAAAIDRFGPLILQWWSKVLASFSAAEQASVVEDLGRLDASAARHLAERVIVGISPTSPEADKRVAIEYLTAIPMTVRAILATDIHMPQSPEMIATKVDDRTLLRFLPINVPPFAAPCDLTDTPYRLEELLGTGGFGVVYKATNRFEQNSAPRAIKFCLSPQKVASLQRERDLLDRLMAAGGDRQWSDRIVQLYGHSLESPIPFLVYEYVTGGPLSSRLATIRRRTGQNLRPAQVLGLIRRLCESVAFAHARGLVHRDLKPSNILVRGNAIKLADFGIGGAVTNFASKAGSPGHLQLSELSASEMGSIFRGAGTPLYMSPEQRQGDSADPRNDVYSIGVIWYQLLVGDFSRELHAGWAAELAEEFDVPQKHIDLIQLCAGYLKKRPSTAKELLASLPSPTSPALPPIKHDAVGEVATFRGHESRVTCVGFLRDSRRLVSGVSNGTVHLWEIGCQKSISTLKLSARSVYSAAVSPDDRRALFGCDDCNAWLWDFGRNSSPTCLSGHTRYVQCVAFSSDGRRAATGSDDGTIRLWHVASGREILRIDEESKPVTGVTFSPDGMFLLSCSESGTLRIWDAETGWEAQELIGTGAPLHCIAISADGRLVACGGRETFIVWDLQSGRIVTRLDGHGATVTGLAFTPNCRWLLSGGTDARVCLWDVASFRVRHSFDGPRCGINALSCAPNGLYAASASDDRTVRVWALPELDSSPV